MKIKDRPLSCICLAAGSSTRMGSDHKLLKAWEGSTVIESVVRDLLRFPFEDIIVVTGARQSEMEALLEDYPVRLIQNEDYAKGLHSSIRTGVRALGESSAFVLVLGDQPIELFERIQRICEGAWTEESLVRSMVKGKPGHPVLIGKTYKEEILRHEDFDGGASYLFQGHPFLSVEQGESALWDLDTPEDFERFARRL